MDEFEEVPQEVRERAASASTSQGESRPRARSGFGSEKIAAGDLIEHPQVVAPRPQQKGADRAWRVDFQALDQLQLREIARMSAPTAITIGSVVIVSLQQFDSACHADMAQDMPGDHEAIEHRIDGVDATHAEVSFDFTERWRNAMIFEMGLDEYQAFLLAWRQADHGHRR